MIGWLFGCCVVSEKREPPLKFPKAKLLFAQIPLKYSFLHLFLVLVHVKGKQDGEKIKQIEGNEARYQWPVSLKGSKVLVYNSFIFLFFFEVLGYFSFYCTPRIDKNIKRDCERLVKD